MQFEEEGSDEEEGLISQGKKKCYVCKDQGHDASECAKDPNLRTSHNALIENERIARISGNASYQEQSIVTQNMLEKLIS